MATISILGDIGASVQAEDIITQIQEAKGDKIKVLIASPGGSAFQGLMIHDALKASGKEVTTIALGLGASAAFIIFLAGDKREMGDATLLMGHNSRTELAGTAAQIRDDLEAMDAIDDRMKAAVMAASGMSDEDATKLLSKDTFMNLKTAMDLGLATDSIQDDIAASLNMNKQTKEPVKMATKEETKKAGLFKHMAAFFQSEHKEEEAPSAGTKLSSVLDSAIESKVSDEVSRGDLISQIASVSDIDESTVNGIISGEIDCPPEPRLSGFAEVLDISMDSIMTAWSADGCSASQDEDAKADHEDEDKEEAKADHEDDEEEAKADHDDEDEEKKEMKARIESLESELAATKAEHEDEDEDEKKEEEAKVSAILSGITDKKITMHTAINLSKKSPSEVSAILKDLSANATGRGKTKEPKADASGSKADQWKALKAEGNHRDAQKLYNKYSNEIGSEMSKDK